MREEERAAGGSRQVTRAGGGSRSERFVPEAGRGHLSEEEGREGDCHCYLGPRVAREGLTSPSSLGIKGWRQAGRQAGRPQLQNCGCAFRNKGHGSILSSEEQC